MIKNQNILHFKDGFEKEGYLYLVLEYMENGSLSDLVKKMGKISENILKKIIYQVLIGLHYLHSQKIIHRDIKGANILLDKNL